MATPSIWWVGKPGLGEEIGLSRVTVNRALHALAAAGIIRVGPAW
jgi:DNA-binding GntR family transcriptional regulator